VTESFPSANAGCVFTPQKSTIIGIISAPTDRGRAATKNAQKLKEPIFSVPCFFRVLTNVNSIREVIICGFYSSENSNLLDKREIQCYNQTSFKIRKHCVQEMCMKEILLDNNPLQKDLRMCMLKLIATKFTS